MSEFAAEGSPKQVAEQLAARFAKDLEYNIRLLVWRENEPPLPRDNPRFVNWVNKQVALVEKHWPWMLEEMEGLAKATGHKTEDILWLNLRVWQYDNKGDYAAPQCSSLLLRLADGHRAVTGTLDDPAELYCGPVKFVPDHGHAFISFPITGTIWGGRGLNSAGLAVSTSGQSLPDFHWSEQALCGDLCKRAILQTCSTAAEVREFCREHHFAMNLICLDAGGDAYCAHLTPAGPIDLEITEDFFALTNHITHDRHYAWLREHGLSAVKESPTTRFRRSTQLAFARAKNGRCSPEEVRDFIGKKHDNDPAALTHPKTVAVTYAAPETDKNRLWVRMPSERHGATEFEEFSV